MTTEQDTRAQTHDYTLRTWGHDYTISKVIDNGRTLHASGWGEGIREGDYLILQNGEGSTRYAVEAISYYADPRDMWSATLRFAPRGQS